MVKNPPASAGDAASVSGLGRSPGEGNGNTTVSVTAHVSGVPEVLLIG